MLRHKHAPLALAIFAGMASGAEAILPLFEQAIPRGVFALVSFVAVTAAAILRWLALRGGDDA